MTYVSSQSLTMPMRLSVMQAQASLAQAQSEISSGVHADLGLSLGAKTGTSLSLKSEIDRLTSFTTTNALASTRLDATSTALSSILTAAQSMSASLITASSGGVSATSLTSSAQGALQNLIGALNTSAAGQFVFGGINTDTTPISTYTSGSDAKQAVDGAFQATFGASQSSTAAATISGDDMQAFLDNQFASLFSDSNWQADWSGASNQTITSDIAPAQTVTTSVSGNETALRQITQAYTMLSEFTGANLSDGARAAVVASATKLVNTAIYGLTNLASGVGVAQATISTVNDRSSEQVTVLTSSVQNLESVDPYALSSKITQLQTQLEASYELTSRLSQLSLVNYLNG